MKVSDILRVKGNTLFTVSPDQPLHEAVVTMAEHDIGSLVVMDHGELTGMLLTDKILPVCQFFAYLEVGESGGSAFDLSDSSLWTLYERLRNSGAPLSMRKVSERSEIFPVFHDLFQRRDTAQEKAAP